MAGNVWQWVQDCLTTSYAGAPADGSAWSAGNCKRHILRAGSWLSGYLTVRRANRVRLAIGDRGTAVGFHIARILER